MECSGTRVAGRFGVAACSPVRHARMGAGVGAAAIWFALAGATVRAQAPQPFVPDITERSGLLMRFAATPELLPPDPHRDNFYNTRYADKGRVKYPNWYAPRACTAWAENACDGERLSLLLRHAGPEHR